METDITKIGDLVLQIDWLALGISTGLLIGAILVGLILHLVIFSILKRIVQSTDSTFDDSFYKHSRRPARLLILLFSISFVFPFVTFNSSTMDLLKRLLSIGFIGSVAWLVIAMTYILDDFVSARFNMKVKDNLEARKVHTQLGVIKRIIIFTVVVVAVATMLMTFDKVKQLGASILTSAGIVGIVVGFAAQKTIANMFAGLQLAITQPIRVEDVVIVEGEWGWIEEINLSYVVVRIWDLRRLIVPVSNFIQQPFQNWTRVTADLLGTVFLYVDYTIPIEEVRAELTRIVEASPLWDKKVCNLQVTDSKEQTLELRALVSAGDSSKAWDLRCEVREKLVTYIQQNWPDHLPRVRAEMSKKIYTKPKK